MPEEDDTKVLATESQENEETGKKAPEDDDGTGGESTAEPESDDEVDVEETEEGDGDGGDETPKSKNTVSFNFKLPFKKEGDEFVIRLSQMQLYIVIGMFSFVLLVLILK